MGCKISWRSGLVSGLGLVIGSLSTAWADIAALGFEDIADWYSNESVVFLEAESTTEGNAALAVPISGYTRVMSSDITPTPTTFPVDLTELWVDLRIPSDHTGWIGSIQPVIRVPDAGVWWRTLNSIDLSGVERDRYISIAFAVPSDLAQALRAGSYFTIYFNLNAGAGGSPWLLDNARFSEQAPQPDTTDGSSSADDGQAAETGGSPSINLGAAGAFNAYLFESFTAQSSDVQGRLFAGQDVDINHYSIGDQLQPAAAGNVLVAGRDIRFPSGAAYFGSIVAAGSVEQIGDPVRNGMAAGATITGNTALPFDHVATKTHLETLSANLAELTPNGEVTFQWGGLYMTGDHTSDVQVFELDGSQLLSSHTFSVDGIPAGAHVVFNISGTNAGLTNMSMESMAPHNVRTLYNFHQAQTLQFSGVGIHGSVLAPYADIHNPQGVIYGSLVAKNWNGMMQFNHHPFIPFDSATNPPEIAFQNVPDPAVFSTSDVSLAINFSDPDDDLNLGSITWTLNSQDWPVSCEVSDSNAFCTVAGLADGPHQIEVSIRDSSNQVAQASVSIRVDTTQPQIQFVSPVAGTPIGDARPDLVVEFDDSGVGVDGQTLNIQVVDGPALSCSVGSNTATCQLTADLTDGEHTATATISDAAGHVSATASTTFQTDTVPPVITVSAPPQDSTTFAGEVTLVGSLSESSVLTINGQQVSVSPDNQFWYFTPVAFGANVWALSATDAAGLNTTLEHRVVRSRSIPEIVSTPATEIRAGQHYTYSVVATDADPDDELTYALQSGPVGMQIGASTGFVSWATPADSSGDFAVAVTATDRNADAATQSFVVTVLSNTPPTAEAQSLQTDEGTPVSFTLGGLDAEGDSITFSVTSQPAHGSLSGELPSLTYTPNPGHAGVDQLLFVASDYARTSDPAVVTIDTLPALAAPEITSEAPTHIDERAQYVYDVIATDGSSADVLTYSLADSPPEMTINSETGQVLWDVPEGYLPSVAVANDVCFVAELPDAGQFEPVVKWTKESTHRSIGTPIVGPLVDTNSDGRYDELDNPTILYVKHTGNLDFAPGQLVAVRGDDGRQHWVSSIDTSATAVPAIGDIDGDLLPDVVMYTHDGGVAALNNDGTVKWVSSYPGRVSDYNYSAINLADIDGDGLVEILARDHVLNSDGSLRLALTPGSQGATIYGADFNNDGVQELVQGERVFTASGADYWDNSDKRSSYSAYANFDGDPSAELISSSYTDIRLIDHDGTTIWSIPFPGGGSGAPTVGDMTGDGLPNIGLAGRNYHLVLDASGTVLWKNRIEENTSHQTSSTLFDFDGDGKVEILYADTRYIRAYDGATGSTVFSVYRESPTIKEYPVVADIDNDGQAEFVYNGYGLTVFEDLNDSWMPTRSIWNQYDYNIQNINDDATLPAQPVAGLLSHNSFRLNAFPDQSSSGLADLRVHSIEVESGVDSLSISALVDNRGLADIRVPTNVHFYGGDPADAGQLLGTVELPRLAAGESTQLGIANIDAESLGNELFVSIDTQVTNRECSTNNNLARAALVTVRVTDSSDLFDEQRFAINVNDVNEAPVVDAQNLEQATVEKPYQATIAASDPDIGDGLRYTLIGGPLGLSINELNGRLSWTPFTSQVGDHPFTVRVDDLRGLSDERDFSITVIDPLVLDDHGLCGVIEHDADRVRQGRFSVDSDEFYFVSNIANDYVVNVHNVALGHITHSIPLPRLTRITQPAASPDGKYIYIPLVRPDNYRYVERISTETHEITRSYRGSRFGWRYIRDSAMSPDNNALYLTDYGSLYKLDLIGGSMTSIYIDPERSGQEDFGGIALSEQGRTLYTVGRAGGLAFAVNTDTRQKIASIPHGVGDRWSSSTTTLSMSHDQTRVYVSHTTNPDIAVIDTDPESPTYNQKIATLDTGEYITRYTQVSNDDRYLYANSPDPAHVLVFGTDPSVPESYHQLVHVIDIAQAGEHPGRIEFHHSDDAYVPVGKQLNVICQKDNVESTPPVLTSQPPAQVQVGDPTAYVHDLEVADPDVDDIHFFVLTQHPDGMVIDEFTGEIRWAPTVEQVGQHRVTVRVFDSDGLYYIKRFAIEVEPPNQLPTFTSAPITTATHGISYDYVVQAQDDDGDALSYSLIAAPGGMAIDGDTGVVTWTPAGDQIGNNTVTIAVDDAHGGTAQQSYEISVAVNTPPSVGSVPGASGKTGYGYLYDMAVSNPEPEVLQFELTAAPAGMSIDAQGSIAWLPTEDDIGQHLITARVSDAVQWVEQTWSLEIIDGSLPLAATIELDPAVVEPDETTLISVVAQNAGGDVTLSLSVDGVPVTLGSHGQAQFSTEQLGAHQVVATVSDVSGSANSQAELFVRDPNDTEHPVVSIDNLDDAQVVTAPHLVTATVEDPSLISWSLSLLEPGGQVIRQLAADTVAPTSQPVAELDPTLLRNGLYILELSAKDAGANISTLRQAVVVDGQMKVGPFQIAFEDLNIPTSGIPLVLTRAYDSRDGSQQLDFGAGWRTDYQGVRLQRSRELGRDWGLREYTSGFTTTYCVESDRVNLVVVTLPDGQTERFATVASPQCNDFQPILDVDFAFEALTSRGYTLQDTSGLGGRLINGHIADPGQPSQPLDSDRFLLTTPEGFEYRLDAAFGVRSVTDPNGNVVTYGDSAIIHSSGLSISIARDAQGRITSVTDPNGAELDYNYNAQGKLISVTDRTGNVTRYAYSDDGQLTRMTDPAGTTVLDNSYDSQGRLESQADASGLTIDFTNDIAGRQQIVRDRNGNATVYIYDERGNVVSETNALGQTITRTYDGQDNLLSETDALGNVTSFTYDSRGNQLSETDALGNTTTSSYDSGNRLLTLSGPDGTLQVTNTYTATGLPSTITDALGHATAFTYNPFGDLLTITDALGRVTTNTYDASGFKTSETLPSGQRTDWTHDSNGNPLTETVTIGLPDGSTQVRVTRYDYDAEGRVTATTHPDGSVTTTEYDANGNPDKDIDALGRETSTTYDGNGQPSLVTYPDGTTESTEYDGNGNVVETTNQSGHVTANTYDVAGRLTHTTAAHGTVDAATTVQAYDAAGRLTQVTDPDGNTVTYGYDAAGRRTTVTDALGNVTTFEYDAEGQKTAEIDPNGNRTAYTLNANGQRTHTTYADGSQTSTVYDALGRKTGYTDEMGHTTTYEYTSGDQLAAVIDPLGHRTEYTFDAAGNKRSQTDANGRITTWSYDLLDRVTARTLPLGQQETHQYDAAGRRSRSTDFNGQVITYTYDSLDRETERSYGDGTRITHTYTPTGQVSTATRYETTNPTGLTTSYSYDNQDRLTQLTDPNGNVISYGYDTAGNRTSQTKLGQTTTYAYDAVNRLTGVTNAQGTTSTTFDANGNVIRIDRPNGSATVTTYDTRNRVTDISHQDAAGGVLASSAYTHNARGQRSSETNADGTHSSHTYDASGRLTDSTVTNAQGNTSTTSWTFDAAGNRLTQTHNGITTTYTVDANDRLTQTSDGTTVTSYTYDNQGNLLTEAENGVQTASYTYSGDHTLIQSTTGSNTTGYRYDAAHARIEQSSTTAAGTSTTRYLIDANFAYAQVVAELDDSNTPIITYSIGNQRISQSDAQTGQTHYLHQDGLGSTRLITDETGAPVGAYRFTAYGQIAEQSGIAETDFLYAGEQRDQATDNYYLRARYYDPSQGRLTQFDPFQGFDTRPISLHKYLYGNADPINTVDPSGNFGLASIGAGLNGRAILAGRVAGSRALRQAAERTLLPILQTTGRAGGKAALRRLRRCIREATKCALNANILIFGRDTPDMLAHVRDAQAFNPRSVVLTYDPKPRARNRQWYRGRGPCTLPTPALKQCDEYPMFRTKQGGPENANFVSLRYVPGRQNAVMGGHFSFLTRNMKGRRAQRKFVVITSWNLPSLALPVGRKK